MRDLMVMIRALVDGSDTQRQREKCILKHLNEHTDSKDLQLMDFFFNLFFIYIYILSSRRGGGNPVPEQQSAKDDEV